MGDLTRISKFLSPYKKEVVFSIIFLGLVVFADLYVPSLITTIIDKGIKNQDMDVIINTSLMMIGASVLSAILSIANTYYSVRAARNFEADLRDALFKKIQTFSFGNLDDFSTGQLMTRLTSDINQIQMIVTMGLRMFTRAPLMFFGSFTIMFTTNFELALVILALLPITLVLVFFFIRLVQPLFTLIQERLEALNQVLQENLSGIRVVKAFVRREHENNRFEKANNDLFGTSLKMSQYMSIFFPIIMSIMNMGTVALIYFGGLQVYDGVTSVGQIMAFTNYLFSTMFPVLMLSMMAGQISAAGASAERIMQVMDSESEIIDKHDAIVLEKIKGKVVFDDVTFSYRDDGGDPVLRNISFTAKPGEKVAILGSTGSGKSSLVNLIPRFYDVNEGRVIIDDVDVKNFNTNNLRSHIGISLQEAVLFSGTIKDNIKYGRPDATDEEVITAAKAAQAHDFIMRFPQGYDTMVGQRGVNLSGGQKQRMAIARALLLKPKILILDDSTSAVDVETEAEIEDALEVLLNDTTSFIVAQRISTVLKADKILVLDNGKIAAEGSHKELIETSPIYMEIYDSQLGGGGAQA